MKKTSPASRATIRTLIVRKRGFIGVTILSKLLFDTAREFARNLRSGIYHNRFVANKLCTLARILGAVLRCADELGPLNFREN